MNPVQRRRRLAPPSILGLFGAIALAGLLFGTAGARGDSLGAYPIDAKKISVSGISSGAFMANQLHIAHSALFMGAGLVAGGLYGCAVDTVERDHPVSLASDATGRCMSAPALLPDVASQAAQIRQFAFKNWIDPLENLAHARVYLFTGASDAVVNSDTVRHAAKLYAALGVPDSQILLRDDYGVAANAGHSWVTADYGIACDSNASPYINNCGYDQAQDILTHLYGPLQPRVDQPTGTIHAFAQAEFVTPIKGEPTGMADTGFIYVPKACEPGGHARCALHVVLHGCAQTTADIGDKFYRHVGVNEWADSNNIVVLYPQAKRIDAEDFAANPQPTDTWQINPEGCWNWWGYAYDSHYLLRDGVQLNAIYRMTQRVAGLNG